ncbi:MAG: hypothetical protein H7Z75_19205, partial [Ferruginibacter sp.]|nr:hypothetical protein [Cytophagales bacterium]
MTKSVLLAGVLFGFLPVRREAYGQLAESDTAFLRKSLAYATDLYTQAIGVHSSLYNGSQHVGYDPHVRSHPYLESDDWQAGSVRYDGVWYRDVSALYDIVGDELIIQHYNRGFEIQLLREKISHFSLPNHTFVRLVPDSTNAALRAGFYDQLYDGKVAVLAKRTKIVEESTT